MNADLEATLKELGPEYRDLVARMRAPFTEGQPKRIRGGFRIPLALAASLLLALGLAAVLLRESANESAAASVYLARGVRATNKYALAYVGSDAAFREIIRTQQADGGWGNRLLTEQNVAALRNFSDPAAELAVRRGLRNLRLSSVH